MPKVNSSFFPKVARLYNAVDSTNAALIEALRAERTTTSGGAAAGAVGRGGEEGRLANGAVFRALYQTAGRGQATNTWHSSPGQNLLLSFLLRPDDLAVDRLFELTKWASVAVARTVEAELEGTDAPPVRIKWPNDIYVGDLKIAGILVQNGLRGSRVDWSVIGIGLNVNEVNFPPALKATATSLYLLTGGAHDPDDVAQRLYAEIAAAYSKLAGDDRTLTRAYLERFYRLEQATNFVETRNGRAFVGTPVGVDRAGELLVRRAGGGVEGFALRSLRWV